MFEIKVEYVTNEGLQIWDYQNSSYIGTIENSSELNENDLLNEINKIIVQFNNDFSWKWEIIR